MKKIGFVSTFNQRCGLATYGRYLTENFSPNDLIILAEDLPLTLRTGPDEAGVFRCWKRNSNDYSQLLSVIRQNQVDLLHLNCQHSFFEPKAFSEVLRVLRSEGVRVISQFHSVYGAIERVQQLVAASDSLVVHLPENRIELLANSAKPEQIFVIPHGVAIPTDRDKARARARVGMSDAQQNVVTFGFMRAHKGVHEVIPAVYLIRQHFPRVHLYVVGQFHEEDVESYDYYQGLQRRAVELEASDYTHFVSQFVPDDVLQDFLVGADLIVLNYQSKDYEASGALALALGAGGSVVCSTAPPFAQAGDAVFHYTSQHIEKGFSLPVAMAAVLGNATLRDYLSAQAKRYAEANAWPKVAREFAALYSRVSGRQINSI